MDHRFDKIQGQQLISAMESLSDQTVPAWVGKDIVRGPDELDLVPSGIDDTMHKTDQELREILNLHKK